MLQGIAGSSPAMTGVFKAKTGVVRRFSLRLLKGDEVCPILLRLLCPVTPNTDNSQYLCYTVPMDFNRNLPIGIQDFEDLRTNDYVYVDKTEHIYNLVHFGKPYFLSRPRRFGKSLFLSTLKYYFLGKKELFKGLAIEKLEKDNSEAWQKYPVLYFDFNGQNYQEKGALESSISAVLKNYEQEYGISSAEDKRVPRIRTENR